MVDLSGNRAAIKVEDFNEHHASLRAKNGAKAIEEFESLVINAPFTNHAAKLLRNKTKNRYKNVIPCEFSAIPFYVTSSDCFLQTTTHEWC